MAFISSNFFLLLFFSGGVSDYTYVRPDDVALGSLTLFSFFHRSSLCPHTGRFLLV